MEDFGLGHRTLRQWAAPHGGTGYRAQARSIAPRSAGEATGFNWHSKASRSNAFFRKSGSSCAVITMTGGGAGWPRNRASTSKPGHARHVEVEQHAVERALRHFGDQFLAGREARHVVAVRLQQARQRAAVVLLVVEDGDHAAGLPHAGSVRCGRPHRHWTLVQWRRGDVQWRASLSAGPGTHGVTGAQPASGLNTRVAATLAAEDGARHPRCRRARAGRDHDGRRCRISTAIVHAWEYRARRAVERDGSVPSSRGRSCGRTSRPRSEHPLEAAGAAGCVLPEALAALPPPERPSGLKTSGGGRAALWPRSVAEGAVRRLPWKIRTSLSWRPWVEAAGATSHSVDDGACRSSLFAPTLGGAG